MELAQLGREPIAAGRPAGDEVRYHPLFDALQSEVDKLSSAAAQSPVDWEKVEQQSAEILAVRSKDLLVAGYLAVALIHTRGYQGLELGLGVYRDLLLNFWEELYPPRSRMRGRVRAIQWWLEKCAQALTVSEEHPMPSPQRVAVWEKLEAIEALLRDRLEDPPTFAPLKTLLAAPAEELGDAGLTSQAPGLEPPLASAPAADPDPFPFPEVQGAGSDAAGKAVAHGLDRLQQAAQASLQQDLSHPVGYRLLRAALWCAVETLPPAAAGRTRIPPPDAAARRLLSGLQERGEGAALVLAAEGQLSRFIFWLDLNRITTETLEQMGEPFQQAGAAVRLETSHLLARLPKLEELAFSDGTPFADPKTRQWIASLKVAGSRGLPSASLPGERPDRGDADARIARALREAHALSGQGQLQEAVQMLQGRIDGEGSTKEKLLWRLALAQFFLDLEKKSLALPSLEQVLDDIELHRLESYDAALALAALKLVWVGFTAQNEARYREKAEKVLLRIGRLDAVEMLKLERTEKSECAVPQLRD